MNERENWSDLRDRRLKSPAAGMAYEHARSAFEIGQMIRGSARRGGSASASWPC